MSRKIKETAIIATPSEEETMALVQQLKDAEKLQKEIAKQEEKMAKIDKQIRVLNGQDLKDLFDKYPNVSIRQLSLALEVTYGLILKASKAPIVGKAYDPEAINYDALANEFVKRNKSFLEDNVDWNALNESKTAKATLVKDLDAFEVGKQVYLRKNNDLPYNIVYKTETHIVIQLEGTSEPQAWSHQTFLYNGPSFEKRTANIEDPNPTTPAESEQVAE